MIRRPHPFPPNPSVAPPSGAVWSRPPRPSATAGALGLLDDADEDAEAVDRFLPVDLLSPPPPRQESEREESAAGKRGGGGGLEVVAWGIDKWWRAHAGPPDAPRYAEKAPRRVAGGARVSPRPIQQPR